MESSRKRRRAGLAETIELYGLTYLARGLTERIGGDSDLENPATRADLESRLRQLRDTLAALAMLLS